MAQKRKGNKGNTAGTATNDVGNKGNTNEGVAPTEVKKGTGIKMGLTAEQIDALLSKTRQKGVYTERLNEFIASGEGGVCVNEEWNDLKGKKASTLKQGFEAAKEKKEASEGADKVIVKIDGDKDDQKVYLINLVAAGVQLPEAA